MTIIDWSVNYETGNALVDSQHCQLFALINALHDQIVARRTNETIGEVLLKLNRYVTEHFTAEEQLMSIMGFPGTAEHKLLHGALAAKTIDLTLRHQAGTLILSVTVSQLLGQWLTEHILLEDRKMIDWVRTEGRMRENFSGSFPSTTKRYPSSGTLQIRDDRLKNALAAARESVGRLAVAQGKKNGD